MLNDVEEPARDTIEVVNEIKIQMDDTKKR